MKILRRCYRFYGTEISKPVKMTKENYLEPEEWDLKFEKPSQVRLRAFVEKNYIKDEAIGKDETAVYKNPEYFSYHPMSYYNIEEDLNCKRCKPQPSPFSRILFYFTKSDKSP